MLELIEADEAGTKQVSFDTILSPNRQTWKMAHEYPLAPCQGCGERNCLEIPLFSGIGTYNEGLRQPDPHDRCQLIN